MLSTCLANLREKSPLVHSITNFVTVNDCANLLLACGARPIMASDPQEAAEITAAADALNINIGTLNHLLVPAMLDAGRTANRLGIPVLLDPVGVGASSLRRQTVAQLLKELKLTAIRANASEIRAIARLEQAQPSGPSAGVDALPDDLVTKEQLGQNIKLARQLAEKLGCIIILTGPVDIVTDGKKSGVYLQRTPDDEPHHRSRLPAVRPDRRLFGSQSRFLAGCRRCCRLHYGTVRAARL